MSHPLKLQIGKRYVSRDGVITDPLVATDFSNTYSETHPFSDGCRTYTVDGYWSFDDDPHQRDLVCEYTESKAVEIALIPMPLGFPAKELCDSMIRRLQIEAQNHGLSLTELKAKLSDPSVNKYNYPNTRAGRLERCSIQVIIDILDTEGLEH